MKFLYLDNSHCNLLLNRIAILFSIFLFSFTQSYSQDCLPEGLTITNQADVDEFINQYPECTRIIGDLQIFPTSPIDLSSLINIESIGGNVGFDYDFSLDGLNNLKTIDGNFSTGQLFIGFDGLDSLRHIGGDFNLLGSPIKDFKGLESLTTVHGDFYITDCPILFNFVGLEKLISIGGNLDLWDSEIVNFIGLESLKVTGGLKLYQNVNFEGFIGLEKLKTINGGFSVSLQDIHTGFTGLDSLKTIGEEFSFWNVWQFTDFTGLESLSSIGGGLSLSFNQHLSCLTGLSDSLNIGGKIFLFKNPNLSPCEDYFICEHVENGNPIEIESNGPGFYSIDELAIYCEALLQGCPINDLIFTSQEDVDEFINLYPDCTEIYGDLSIITSSQIDLSSLNKIEIIRGDVLFDGKFSLTGLNNLKTIEGSLEIGQNITGFIGLNSLSTIAGNFELEGSSNTNFVGLNALTSIGGDFYINDNDSFINFIGLDNLATIAGKFKINDSEIINFLGLESLKTIGRNFELKNNGVIEGFAGLDSLTTIVESFRIESQEIIGDFTGLKSLSDIGASFILREVTNLNDFTGLEELVSIGGILEIKSNTELNSLSGLGDSLVIGSVININGNSNLSTCPNYFLCNHIASGKAINIYENDSGCNNMEELIVNCDNIINIENLQKDIRISPNPANNWLYIETDLNSQNELEINTFSGLTVLKTSFTKNKRIDISSFESGLYLIKIKSNNRYYSYKIIKI